MPNVIATKTVVFTDHLHVSGGEVHVKVDPKPGAQEIPDWALKTKTYEMALQSGAICLIGDLNPEAAEPKGELPPTMEKLLSFGLNTDEAEKIFTEEKRKFEAGEAPYPPLVAKQDQPLAAPTVDSLIHAGMDRTSAEKFMADRDKKNRKQPQY